jgi:hypothetical protein
MPALSGAAQPPLPVRLDARHSEALSELLPLLLCGEESAVLSIARYGSSVVLGASGRRDFQLIQADEAYHARCLQRLRGSLPAPRSDARQRARLRWFYARQSDPDFGDHLARIAALDSAVCLILGALRQQRGPSRKTRQLDGCSSAFTRMKRAMSRSPAGTRQSLATRLIYTKWLPTRAINLRQCSQSEPERSSHSESAPTACSSGCDRFRGICSREYDKQPRYVVME